MAFKFLCHSWQPQLNIDTIQSLNFSRFMVKAGQAHPCFVDKFFSWISINFWILKMRFSWVLCFADIRGPKPEVSVVHLDAILPFLYKKKKNCSKDGPTAAGFVLSHSKALFVWISCFLSGSTERNSTRSSCVKQEWWQTRKKKNFGLKEKPGEMVEESSLGFNRGVKKNTFFWWKLNMVYSSWQLIPANIYNSIRLQEASTHGNENLNEWDPVKG